MYCRNCGRELKEDSTFCDKCGTKIEIPEEIKAVNEKENNSVLIAILILAAVFVTVLGIIMIAVTTNNNNNVTNNSDTNKTNNSLTNLFSKKATSNDITMDYYEIPSLGGAEKYYAILQANEKIDDLVIEIKFLDKDQNVLKTETIKVGKVAPGNEYKFEIDQSGIDINKIGKTKSFKTRVIEGYITE